MSDKKQDSIYSKRIMITAPSLDVKDNVSGVSTLVSDIINNSKFNFVHLKLGSKDAYKKKNLSWIFGQVSAYINLLWITLTTRYDIVHINIGLEKLSILRDSIVFFIVNVIFRKKVILHIHGGFYLMNDPGSGMIAFLLKKIINKAKIIIVLSDLEKTILIKRYGNLPVYVFNNAVDTDAIMKAGESAVNSKIKFVYMGRIVEMKGIYTISDCLQYLTKYFPLFSLDIYGAGAELTNWTASLDKHQGFEYTYKGVVTGDDKWRALHAADVFLLPSLHSEGMPIAMIEAMAAGCVVIVTDVASVKVVINDNVNGMLLSESIPQLLALKMEEIILGKVDVHSISENAKQYVLKNLSLKEYINKLDHLYANV